MRRIAILIIAVILSAVIAPDFHANEGVGLVHGISSITSQVISPSSLDHSQHAQSDQPGDDSGSEEGHSCHAGHCPAVLVYFVSASDIQPSMEGFLPSDLFFEAVDLARLRRPPRA